MQSRFYVTIHNDPRTGLINQVEQLWQYLRTKNLSNRVFDDYDDIIAAACDAWRKLTHSLTAADHLNRYAR